MSNDSRTKNAARNLFFGTITRIYNLIVPFLMRTAMIYWLKNRQPELWRDRLIADEDTLAAWMAEHPTTDTQQLRALIRQARKDAQPAGKEANVQVSQGLAPRKGRAYRELFQLVREHLGGTGTADAGDTDEDNDDE